MKTRDIIFALFALITFSANAQYDYSSYLHKAMEKLEQGDCQAAQKFYDVYKELSGQSVSSLEVLIADCGESQDKTYNIGDQIKV
ncbi:MAG: hypothetical protein K5660_07645 [Paludibacteraceae bacterium]|nr:hypothetical protein [Paludibacteraceae bacterium]